VIHKPGETNGPFNGAIFLFGGSFAIRRMRLHGAEFAGGRRHGNDSYIKAASDEREKLLTTKLKGICRGIVGNQELAANPPPRTGG
jgi:hypothetical protein